MAGLDKWTTRQFLDRMTPAQVWGLLGSAAGLFAMGMALGLWVTGPVAQREIARLQMQVDSLTARLTDQSSGQHNVARGQCGQYNVIPGKLPADSPPNRAFQITGRADTPPPGLRLWFFSTVMDGGTRGYFPRGPVQVRDGLWVIDESAEDRGRGTVKQYGLYLVREDLTSVIAAYESDMRDLRRRWMDAVGDRAPFVWTPLRLSDSVVDQCFEFTVTS